MCLGLITVSALMCAPSFQKLGSVNEIYDNAYKLLLALMTLLLFLASYMCLNIFYKLFFLSCMSIFIVGSLGYVHRWKKIKVSSPPLSRNHTTITA